MYDLLTLEIERKFATISLNQVGMQVQHKHEGAKQKKRLSLNILIMLGMRTTLIIQQVYYQRK